MSKRRWNQPRIWLILAGLLIAGYLVVLPILDGIQAAGVAASRKSVVIEDMSLAEHARLRSTEVVIGLLFFAVGASIGSFLNVVAYRLPREESLISKPSRCPACGTRILGQDNVPVLGWIRLRGRCRFCSVPISVRYPVVEALTGAIFVLFYFAELLSGGANLPVRVPNAYAGVVWIVLYPKWNLIGLYAVHCASLCVLMAWALIAIDGARGPLKACVIIVALSWIVAVLCPGLLLVAPGTIQASDRNFTITERLLAVWIGGVSGLACGAAVATCFDWPGVGQLQVDRVALLSALGMIGAFGGWQAMVSTVIFTLICHAGIGIVARCRHCRINWPLQVSLLIGAILHQLSWRWLAGMASPWWPGPGSNPQHAALAMVVLMILIGLNRVIWLNAEPGVLSSRPIYADPQK